MCELFAMSSKLPTNVNLSLDEFSLHGGATNHHQHGWGIAYFEGKDARLIRETEAASDSRHLAFMKNHNYTSSTVISHIRYATQGGIQLSNTQPFSRELLGRRFVFAHNGNLQNFSISKDLLYHPIGETDSEKAFCFILNKISECGDGLESPKVQDIIHGIAQQLEGYGPFNFVLSDGETLLAHGHKRTQRSGLLEPPGLHFLCRHCSAEKDQYSKITGVDLEVQKAQEVILIASVPLSTESWVAFRQGETMVISRGSKIRSIV